MTMNSTDPVQRTAGIVLRYARIQEGPGPRLRHRLARPPPAIPADIPARLTQPGQPSRAW
jgi:hypothetical protein